MGNKEETKTKKNITEDHKNGTVKTDEKAKEAIDSLKVQLVEHQKQADYHATMATKAQGALEVLLQLHPQDNSGEGS